MRKKIILALVLSLSLSACSTYETPGGRTRLGDPVICGPIGDGGCLLLIAGAIAGCVALAGNAR
jgi:hypothetical protein